MARTITIRWGWDRYQLDIKGKRYFMHLPFKTATALSAAAAAASATLQNLQFTDKAGASARRDP